MCFKIEIFGLGYFRVQVLLSMSSMDMPIYGSMYCMFVIFSDTVYMDVHSVLDLCLSENEPSLYLKLGV